jgi:hypothetical protein
LEVRVEAVSFKSVTDVFRMFPAGLVRLLGLPSDIFCEAEVDPQMPFLACEAHSEGHVGGYIGLTQNLGVASNVQRDTSGTHPGHS